MSLDPGISLRPALPSDRPFLLRVYAESRADELSATGWSAEEKEIFCRSQFETQDAHYHEYYPACEYLVVELDGKPIGRLYRDRHEDEIRVVDIALLEEARGQGIGGRLMEDILAEAARDGLPVRIHVEKTNPARRLYDRLGFKVEKEGEVYDLLVWTKAV